MEKALEIIRDFFGALGIIGIGFGYGSFWVMISLGHNEIWDCASIFMLVIGVFFGGIALADAIFDRRLAQC